MASPEPAAEPTVRRGPWPLPVIPERRRCNAVAIHAHRHPRWPTFALAGLVCLLAIAIAVLAVYVGNLQDYVNGRGDYRDAEAARIEASIGQAVCDILREFPVGDARADRLRARYHCPIPVAPTEAPS
jgi:hypothetical protein